jgi:membrane-associated phospholipid phosphatase
VSIRTRVRRLRPAGKRAGVLVRRVLSNWWAPLAALALCPLVAWWRPGGERVALQHADAVAGFERSLGVFVEPSLHAWAAHRPALLTVAWVLYLTLHVPVTGAALVWTRLERPAAWPRLRDLFVATQVLVMLVAVVVPTASPARLATSAGGGGPDTSAASLLQTPFAAMPSGHVAFALIAGATVALLTRRWWLRAAGAAYPLVIAAITLVTANHFVSDIVVATVIVLGCGLAVAVRDSRQPALRLGLDAR